MPEFSIHADYCTPTGRQGTRDVVRKAKTIDEAMAKFRAYLHKRGHSKIDMQAWPVNNWKDTTDA